MSKGPIRLHDGTAFTSAFSSGPLVRRVVWELAPNGRVD
jgi:hypothetical protein